MWLLEYASTQDGATERLLYRSEDWKTLRELAFGIPEKVDTWKRFQHPGGLALALWQSGVESLLRSGPTLVSVDTETLEEEKTGVSLVFSFAFACVKDVLNTSDAKEQRKPSVVERRVAQLLRIGGSDLPMVRDRYELLRGPVPPVVIRKGIVYHVSSPRVWPLVWCSIIAGVESGWLTFCRNCVSKALRGEEAPGTVWTDRESGKRQKEYCDLCTRALEREKQRRQDEKRRQVPNERIKSRWRSRISQAVRRGNLSSEDAEALSKLVGLLGSEMSEEALHQEWEKRIRRKLPRRQR